MGPRAVGFILNTVGAIGSKGERPAMPTFYMATLAAPGGGGWEAVTVTHRERMVAMNSKVLA